MRRQIIYIWIILLGCISVQAQQVQKSEEGVFLLKGGTVHTVTNGTIEADVLIRDGMIAQIGQNLTDGNAKVIDVSDHHIYPGMIDGGCRVGLSEVGSVSLTQDYNELGDFIPHMEALTAVNPNSVAIPVTRTNGVTAAFTKPSGGLFPGQGALINMHGYTPEQMHAGFTGVLLNFPSSGRRGWWDRRSAEDIKIAEEKALKKLNDIWDKAVLYARIDSAGQASNQSRQDYNPQMDALVPVVKGDVHLMVEANAKNDILKAIKWIKEKGVQAVLTGVSEGHKVADSIAQAGIPVITGPVLSIPGQADAYDAAYRNPGVMHNAGVKVALRTNNAENVRNLPFNAGFAAAYGMGKEEALKSVTIVPAEIFGVADKYGSLEEGKMASLFVSDGDPFETSSNITHLFIDGWQIPIENRHTLLYEEFLDRNPGVEK